MFPSEGVAVVDAVAVGHVGEQQVQPVEEQQEQFVGEQGVLEENVV